MKRYRWVIVLLAASVWAQQPAADPAHWVTQLGGDRRAEAVQHLREAGVGVALPLLVRCIAEQQGELPFQAARAFGELEPADQQGEKCFAVAATALGEIVRSAVKNTEQRVVAALAIGAMGRRGVAGIQALVAAMVERGAAELSIAAAIALSGVGDSVGKALDKAKGARSPTGSACEQAVLRSLGKKASSAVRTLQKAMASAPESRQALLAGRAMRDTIEVLASKKVAQAAWQDLLEAHAAKQAKGLRLDSGLGAQDPEVAIIMVCEAAGMPGGIAADYSLPKSLAESMSVNRTMIDNLQCFVAHLATEVTGLAAAWRSGEFATLTSWRESTRKIVALGDLLSLPEKAR